LEIGILELDRLMGKKDQSVAGRKRREKKLEENGV
jgi:hypothetical protein